MYHLCSNCYKKIFLARAFLGLCSVCLLVCLSLLPQSLSPTTKAAGMILIGHLGLVDFFTLVLPPGTRIIVN